MQLAVQLTVDLHLIGLRGTSCRMWNLTTPLDTSIISNCRRWSHKAMRQHVHDMLQQKQSSVSSFWYIVDVLKADVTVRNLFPELTVIRLTSFDTASHNLHVWEIILWTATTEDLPALNSVSGATEQCCTAPLSPRLGLLGEGWRGFHRRWIYQQVCRSSEHICYWINSISYSYAWCMVTMWSYGPAVDERRWR